MGIDPDVEVKLDAMQAQIDAISSGPSVEVQSAMGAFVVALNAKILSSSDAENMTLLTAMTAIMNGT